MTTLNVHEPAGQFGARSRICVQDIVAQRHLRIDVVAGAAGLTNPITWAHSSDLPDPSGWLAGGEMVMKNGRTLPRSASEQTTFVQSLAQAGASALVIGMDENTPRITNAMTELADRLRLPLLRVPFSLPFALIGMAVADQVSQSGAEALTRITRVYALIEDAVVRNDPARFIAELKRALDCPVFAIDAATGSNALHGTPALPSASRTALLAELRKRNGQVPALLRVRDGATTELAVITVPDEDATLLVLQQPVGRFIDMPLFQHAATATAVAVAYASLGLEHERELGAELLGKLLDGGLAGEAAERELNMFGIDPGHARMLIAPCADDSMQRTAYHRLRRNGIHHLLARRRGVLHLLIDTSGPTQTVEAVGRHLREISALGVSDVLRSGGRVPGAAREALWALAAARRSGGTVYYGSASAIPAIRDANQAQALVEQVLGTLIRHDQDTGTDLLHTLATFLDCRRSWVKTAQALHVHRQTAIYRMQQIERITGRDIGASKDIAELWLALAALDATQGGQSMMAAKKSVPRTATANS